MKGKFHSDFSEAMSNKYKEEVSYKLSKFAWYSLEKILLKEFSFKIDNKMIEFNKFNKPYIVDSNLHFNISHSCNYVLIGISDCEIGVDIQSQIVEEKADLIIKRFDTKTILEYNETINKIEYFSRKWVQMEAYVKMNGTGLSFDCFKQPIEKEFNYEKIYDKEDNLIYYTCVVNKNNEKGSVEFYVL